MAIGIPSSIVMSKCCLACRSMQGCDRAEEGRRKRTAKAAKQVDRPLADVGGAVCY